MWLRGTNFCINCTISHYFAPRFLKLRNDPKCTQTLWNTPKHEVRVQWVDQVRSLRKITTWLPGTNFCINWTSSVCFATRFMQLPKKSQMHPNTTKRTKTLVLGPMVGLGPFVAKNPTWLCGTNFCINCSSSPSYAPSFMQLRNDPKCTQTQWNTPKHELSV